MKRKELKVKIAFIVTKFPLLSETFILNQITGLLDLGHDVEIFAQFKLSGHGKVHPDFEKYSLSERLYFLSIPQNRIKRLLKAIFLIVTNFHKQPSVILRALNFVKYKKQAMTFDLLYLIIPFLGKKFDIVHCHFGPNGNIGIKLKELGISGRFITSFHGYDISRIPQSEGRDVYNGLFEKGDLFTANTNFTKQQIMKLGCPEKKIEVLPVGLKMERFRFKPRALSKGEVIQILTVGRLTEKKGHEFSLKAVAQLTRAYTNIKYLIAGDGALKEQLVSLASDLGINQYVEFLGPVDENEVLRLYEQAHLFILPCVTAQDGDKEGQALVLQEAQAAGLPVVSTIHNGIPDGVLDGKSAFLVPEKDIDALVSKLKYLIEHPEVWPEMGAQGRKFVETKYNIEHINAKLVGLYESALKKLEPGNAAVMSEGYVQALRSPASPA